MNEQGLVFLSSLLFILALFGFYYVIRTDTTSPTEVETKIKHLMRCAIVNYVDQPKHRLRHDALMDLYTEHRELIYQRIVKQVGEDIVPCYRKVSQIVYQYMDELNH